MAILKELSALTKKLEESSQSEAIVVADFLDDLADDLADSCTDRELREACLASLREIKAWTDFAIAAIGGK